MAQIGISIYGRNPGFQRLYSSNWVGDEPKDNDIRYLVKGQSYFTVRLDGEYATYEYAIKNFKAAGRDAVFSVFLRVPATHIILNEESFPVSPSYILSEIFKLLDGYTVVRHGSIYEIPVQAGLPPIPVEGISSLINALILKRTWGRHIVMNSLPEAQPIYINCTEAEIGMLMRAVPLCNALVGASRVYFGEFNEQATPVYAFTSAELNARPIVKANIYNSKGEVSTQILGDVAIDIKSTDYGYADYAFNLVSVSLKSEDVFNDWLGRVPLPQMPGLNVQMRIEDGAIDIRFMPSPKTETYNIDLKGVDARAPISLANISSIIEGITPLPLSALGISATGNAIEDLRFKLQSSQWLKDHLYIDPKTNYELVGASFIRDTICITVKYNPPKPVESKRGPVHSNTPLLNVYLPLSCKSNDIFVETVLENSKGAKCNMRFMPQFKNDGKRFEAQIQLPANCFDCKVGVGCPPTKWVKACTCSDGTLLADFTNSNVFKGSFGDKFRFKYSKGVSMGTTMWRMLLPLVAALIIFLLGLGIGYFLGNEFPVDRIESELEEVIPFTPESGENHEQGSVVADSIPQINEVQPLESVSATEDKETEAEDKADEPEATVSKDVSSLEERKAASNGITNSGSENADNF